MKGLVFFVAFLIVGVYSSSLTEIKINIKNEWRCGGSGLSVKVTQGYRTCTTYSKNSFWAGDTITFRGEHLGSCRNIDFSRQDRFSLQTSGDRYCPTLVEFLTDADESFVSKVNEGRNKWFGSAHNDITFSVTPVREAVAPVQCPAEGQGCPVNELFVHRQIGEDRKQCTFSCPHVNMVRDTNGEMKTLGQSCYEVSYQVRQYEWCCRLPGTGFPVCQASDTDIKDDEFQVLDSRRRFQ